MDILVLNILIRILKFVFQLWKFCINFLKKHLIWTWNFNSKWIFWNLKINTSILKIINWI
jgi:hypothetical protein